jgi:hypothetical protein
MRPVQFGTTLSSPVGSGSRWCVTLVSFAVGVSEGRDLGVTTWRVRVYGFLGAFYGLSQMRLKNCHCRLTAAHRGV